MTDHQPVLQAGSNMCVCGLPAASHRVRPATDEQIIAVIGHALNHATDDTIDMRRDGKDWLMFHGDIAANVALTALRKAGFDVAPINTIRLGQAVAGCTAKHTPERVEVPR